MRDEEGERGGGENIYKNRKIWERKNKSKSLVFSY